MNDIVTNLLKAQLMNVDADIKWAREELSDLTIAALAVGQSIDGLTAERRAIKDALEASA